MALSTTFIWGEILADERERHHLSQQDVAGTIGEANPKTVSRWERGNAQPGPYYQQKLCELYDKRPEELGFVPGTYPLYWNVPFPRSPFFTGRDGLLNDLHQRFCASRVLGVGLQIALSGLAGIGKTQLAVEYAHHYHEFYHTILWVRADTPETLASDMMELATVLNLPGQERDNADPQAVITSVKRWLSRFNGWLIILDNVEDLRVIHSLFTSHWAGHMLITTRLQPTGAVLQKIPVDTLNHEDGARLLLKRAKIADHATETDWQAAREIAEEMDGLPLALTQAGAFIEQAEEPVESYLNLYRKHGISILNEPDELNTSSHDSVLHTFDLTLAKVRQRNLQAFNLLQLLAFLHPDTIPEELLAKISSEKGMHLESLENDDFKLRNVIKELMTFSLVTRHTESNTLAIHRLVQAVIQSKLDRKQQKLWAERTVRIVNRCFPEIMFRDIAHWPLCERYLPQANACVALIEQREIQSAEAAHLLEQLGIYVMQRLDYKGAETMLQRAVRIREHIYGKEHLTVASTLDYVALSYYFQYENEQSQALFEQALAIKEHLLGPEHPQLVRTLIWMGHHFYDLDIYAEAESLYKRAQFIVEMQTETDLAQLAAILNGLGLVYFKQGNLDEAEDYLQRALAIDKKRWTLHHPSTASALTSLARIYTAQKKYALAEEYFQQALVIRTETLGPTDPAVTSLLQNMALLYQQQGKFEEAKQLYEQQVLAILKQKFGPVSHLLRNALSNYIELLKSAGLSEEAKIHESRLAEIKAQLNREQEATLQSTGESDTLAEVRPEIDSLTAFIKASCELKPDALSHLNEVWDSYIHWAKDQKARQRVRRIQTLAQYLRMKGCQPVHTKKQRLWRGIRLRETVI